jgi:hypothetical protein
VTAPAPTHELLAWIASGPRTYDETIEAWRTSCPRLSIWDDAVIAGLVEVQRSGGSSRVVLSETGAALLASAPGV